MNNLLTQALKLNKAFEENKKEITPSCGLIANILMY